MTEPAETRLRAFITVAAICCGNAGPALVYDALAPVLPQIGAHFATVTHALAPDAIAQAVLSLAVVGMGLAGLFAAAVVARFGFRGTMLGGWLLFGLAGSVGLVGDSVTLLFASRLVVGLMGGMMMAVAGLGIAARYPPAKRPQMMGINLAVGAFTAIAFLFAAAGMAKLSWRAPFALHALLGLIGLLLACFAHLPPRPERRERIAGFWRAMLPAVPAYALLLLMVLAGNLFNVQIVFLLASRGQGDPATLASVCAIMPLALGLTNIAFGMVEARLGVTKSIATGLALFVFGTACCAITPWLPATAVGMIAGGIALGLCTPSAMTLIMRGVAPDRMPAALSFATTLIYLGGGFAPLIYVPLRAIAGYDGIYAWASGTILCCLAAWSIARIFARSAPLSQSRSIP